MLEIDGATFVERELHRPRSPSATRQTGKVNMRKRDLNRYYQCGNCATGTVVLSPKKGLHLDKAVSGGVYGSLGLGLVSFGLLAPIGAVLGASANVSEAMYDHDSACDNCGAVYAGAMVHKLPQKAIPKSVPGQPKYVPGRSRPIPSTPAAPSYEHAPERTAPTSVNQVAAPDAIRIPAPVFLGCVVVFTGLIGFAFHPVWIVTAICVALFWVSQSARARRRAENTAQTNPEAT